MHFHFLYSYFLMHEREPFNFSEIFALMDTYHSLVLEPLKMQRLATVIVIGFYKRADMYRSPPLGTNFGLQLFGGCDWIISRSAHLYATRTE